MPIFSSVTVASVPPTVCLPSVSRTSTGGAVAAPRGAAVARSLAAERPQDMQVVPYEPSRALIAATTLDASSLIGLTTFAALSMSHAGVDAFTPLQ